MADYKNMYFTLFNAVTNAIDELKNAQKQGEEFFINDSESHLILLDIQFKENSDK